MQTITEMELKDQRKLPRGPVFCGHFILMAEDIELNRQLFSLLLSSLMIKNDCAADGLQAVKIFSENPAKYSLIFMDMEMPVMGGCEATRRIRSLDSYYAKRVPIIAITSHNSPGDIAKCLHAGMNDHLSKPYDRDKIIAVLKRYL